jgi:hypothetical protein
VDLFTVVHVVKSVTKMLTVVANKAFVDGNYDKRRKGVSSDINELGCYFIRIRK